MKNVINIINRFNKANSGQLCALAIEKSHNQFQTSSRFFTHIDSAGVASVTSCRFKFSSPDENGKIKDAAHNDLFMANPGSLWLFQVGKAEVGKDEQNKPVIGYEGTVCARRNEKGERIGAMKLAMGQPTKMGLSLLSNWQPFTPTPIQGLRLCYIASQDKQGVTSLNLYIAGFQQTFTVFKNAVSGYGVSMKCESEHQILDGLKGIVNAAGNPVIPQNTRSFIAALTSPFIAMIAAKNDQLTAARTPVQALEEVVVEAVAKPKTFKKTKKA